MAYQSPAWISSPFPGGWLEQRTGRAMAKKRLYGHPCSLRNVEMIKGGGERHGEGIGCEREDWEREV